jgi:hypothetical protein
LTTTARIEKSPLFSTVFARTKNLAEKTKALPPDTRGRAPRRSGRILLLRLTPRNGDTLRFLYDPSVPFTNNQAERDGRMMKLHQKISGRFRSLEA